VTPSQNERARRTGELKKAVALEVQTSSGPDKRNAGRKMVPFWAHDVGKCDAPTISSLARATGMSRSFLSLYLAGKRKSHKAREILEEHLELTTGGMLDVLSVLEGL